MLSKNLMICIFILNSLSLAFAQDKYDSVPEDSLSFGGINTSSTLDETLKIFGSPIVNKTYIYEDGDGPDGFEEQYYLTYENMNLTFLKYRGKAKFSSCIVKTRLIPVKIERNIIQVGDTAERIKELYPHSYSESTKANEESIFIYLEDTDGFIKILLENDLIVSIEIDLDPA